MTEPIATAINFITDTDGEWTRNIIEDLDKIDDQGPDGDVPVQPAFAQDKYFWIISGLGVAMGLFLGLFSLGFMNLIDEVPTIIISLVILFKNQFSLLTTPCLFRFQSSGSTTESSTRSRIAGFTAERLFSMASSIEAYEIKLIILRHFLNRNTGSLLSVELVSW
jgi:hypothetical protein